ncbi:hypothetical protein Tco_0109212, partial [Tanacetum coccineum]
VIMMILDICPRVEGVDFTNVPDDDTALTFLIELGYKASNDKLRKFRIDILWGMFYKENVDYPELIWEDLAFQIDHKKEKKSKREIMPYPRLTKIIINHFLKQTSLSPTSGINTIIQLKMMIPPKKSKGKGSQGKKTTNTLDVSEESEPEPARKKTSSKRRVKKKVTLSANDNIIFDDPNTSLELVKSISLIEAEEVEATRKVHATHARIVTETVLEPARRRPLGKVTFDPPKKLKSVLSLTLEEQEAVDTMKALKESRKSSRRQPDTRGSNEGTGSKPRLPNESTLIFATSSEKTGAKPGVPDEEKDNSEEKVILERGDEQESEYSDDDNNDDVEKDDKDGDADDEGDDHISDTQDADDEDAKTEFDEDEIYEYKIRVRKDEDEEMNNAEVTGSDKGDEEVTDATKVDAEKTSEVKDDAKKTELPPTSFSFFVSSVKVTIDVEISSLMDIKIQSEVPQVQSPFVLKVPVSVISEPSVLTPIPETPSAITVTTSPPPSVSNIPPPRVAKLEKDVSKLKKIDLSVETFDALKIQVPIVVDNYLGSKVRDILQKELKKHTANLIQKYSLPQAQESRRIKTPTINLEQESEKSPSKILKIKKEQAEKQKMPQFTIKSTKKAVLKEYDLTSALYQSMHANKSFNRNRANNRLYHALMEALIEDENAIDKGVADTVKDHKRKHDDDDDDEDPLVGPNQGKQTKRRRTKESKSSKKPSTTKETPKGKAPSKGSKSGKSAFTKEPVEEPIVEVVMDDAGEDVVHDDNQPQDAS